jgi:hypothetical protein
MSAAATKRVAHCIGLAVASSSSGTPAPSTCVTSQPARCELTAGAGIWGSRMYGAGGGAPKSTEVKTGHLGTTGPGKSRADQGFTGPGYSSALYVDMWSWQFPDGRPYGDGMTGRTDCARMCEIRHAAAPLPILGRYAPCGSDRLALELRGRSLARARAAACQRGCQQRVWTIMDRYGLANRLGRQAGALVANADADSNRPG